MSAFAGSTGPLTKLLRVTKNACDVLTPMVVSFYQAINGETSKLKADASVFTIADGMVQHLLIENLFHGGKFHDIVGEEEGTIVNIETKPFMVDDLQVPIEFCDIISNVKDQMKVLSGEIDSNLYKNLNVFIDPIDGTREFSTALGEQCSICIGFSDKTTGLPVAGIVYRPITSQPTWAAGAKSESFKAGNLDVVEVKKINGLLTSNGGVSKFLVKLMEEISFTRVPSGGAGNKMLMLLEGKGGAYIQDRGVSRWDTCGAQAVIEAYGGLLCKLTDFVNKKELNSYTYLKSNSNLDFESGVSNLTPYNAKNPSSVVKGQEVLATDVEQMKPYSNLCGHIALDAACVDQLESIYDGIQRAKLAFPPSYD